MGPPKRYSRLLVVGGLGSLLALDVVVGLPTAAFVGAGVLVLLSAAGLHVRGGQARAGLGWAAFAGALGLFGAVDAGDRLALVTVGALVATGLALLAGQRLEARSDD